MRASFFCVVASALLIAGCASQPVALSPKVQQSIESVQVVLFVPDENLEIAVTPGNAGNTGLLGALIVAAIDESRRKKAAETAQAVVQASSEFGFANRMSTQLAAEFARVPWPRLQGPVQLEQIDSSSQRRIVYDTSRAPAVLMADISYKLLDARLVVTANVQIFPKSPTLMPLRTRPVEGDPLNEGNALYRRSFSFRSDRIAPEQIRNTLNEGLANVAWQVAADMAHVAGSQDTIRTTALAPRFPAAARNPVGTPPNMVVAAPATGVPGPVPPPPSQSQPQRVMANSEWQGAWTGSLRCGAYLGSATARVANRGGWTVPAHLTVDGQSARLERGDATYGEVLTGEIIGAMAQLQGQGRMSQPANAVPWRTQVLGRFTAGDAGGTPRFEGAARIYAADGTHVRDCKLELAPAKS